MIEAEKKNITDAESKVDLEDLAVQSVNANLELTYKKYNKLAMLIDVIIEDTLIQEEDLKKK